MKKQTAIRNLFIAVVSLATLFVSVQATAQSNGLEIKFESNNVHVFSDAEKTQIELATERAKTEVKVLLPNLPENIVVTFSPLAVDLQEVGGVTGRADSPTQVVVYISPLFEGGISSAVETGLAATLYHEFHHLARGWTRASRSKCSNTGSRRSPTAMGSGCTRAPTRRRRWAGG